MHAMIIILYYRDLLSHSNVVVFPIIQVSDNVNSGSLQEQEQSESIGSPPAEHIIAGMGELEVRVQSVSLESSEYSKN